MSSTNDTTRAVKRDDVFQSTADTARYLRARAQHFVRVARLHNQAAIGYRRSREWPRWHNALAGRDGAMTCARELVGVLRVLEAPT